MKIKIKCEPFSHRNERSHHIYCHCHCFIWRNRNRNRSSSNKSTKFIYYRDMFLSSLLFSVMCSFPFHLICVMMMLLPFFCACYLLQHRSSISQYSSSFFEKKGMYTRLISNGEQTLSKNYFYFIFYSSSPPPTFQLASSPSQPFLLYYFSQKYSKKIPQTR